MKKFSFKLLWQALKDAFKGFSDDKVTKLCASLAYYTVFSLGPLLIVMIFLLGVILGQEAAQNSIYLNLQNFIGPDAAKQIQEIIRNASISGKGGIAAVIGVITLLVAATTVFGEIQDSVNSIWGLKPRPKTGIIKLILTRLLSFGMIASLGFLLLVSLGATAVVEALGDRLKARFEDVAVVVFYVVNLVLNLVVVTLLFSVIFKVLPDARIKWKDIWPGAIATSLLFLIGKFAISFYISKSEVGSTYGAAGSLVVLLLWVFYSAIILYFGAEFTKAFALRKGAKVIPNKYAIWDNSETVPGAKDKAVQAGEKDQSAPSFQPKYSENFVHPITQKKKDKGVGILVVGLLLYLFRRNENAKT
jgi:membrane protein